MRRLLGKPLLCRLGRHKWKRIAITVHVSGRPCEVGTKWCCRCGPPGVKVGLVEMGLRGMAQLDREERVRQ